MIHHRASLGLGHPREHISPGKTIIWEQGSRRYFIMKTRQVSLSLISWCALTATYGPCAAVEIKPRDILITSTGVDSGTFDSVVRIEPDSGAQTMVSSGFGGVLNDVAEIVWDPRGKIFVANESPSSNSAIIEIDPTTGNQRVVTTIPFGPFGGGGLALDANGRLLASTGTQILRFDPATCTPMACDKTVVFQSNLRQTGRMAFDGSGRLVAVDTSQSIIFVPTLDGGGMFSDLTSNVLLDRPQSIAIAPDGAPNAGDIFVTQIAKLIRINPATGNQALIVNEFGHSAWPAGVAVEADGNVLVALDDHFLGGFSGVVRVDPTTGAVADLSLNGELVSLGRSGIAVVPIPEPMSWTFAVLGVGLLAASRIVSRRRTY